METAERDLNTLPHHKGIINADHVNAISARGKCRETNEAARSPMIPHGQINSLTLAIAALAPIIKRTIAPTKLIFAAAVLKKAI
jgi:hypothetical protein